jgi:hypothetical protein
MSMLSLLIHTDFLFSAPFSPVSSVCV